MHLGFYGTCFLSGLFALPLSGAGLTFFAAAKKVSKESSFSRQQCASVSARVDRSGPTVGVSLAGFDRCWHLERGTGVAPIYGADQQSYIRLRATRSPDKQN